MSINWGILEATENVCVLSGEKEKEALIYCGPNPPTGKPAEWEKDV